MNKVFCFCMQSMSPGGHKGASSKCSGLVRMVGPCGQACMVVIINDIFESSRCAKYIMLACGPGH